MVFRINESLVSNSNLKLVKNYIAEGITKIDNTTNSRILGEFVGEYFLPDGLSANNRFYPKKFWEYVLNSEDVKNKLARKVMFGRVGHIDRDNEDDDINSGLISHIVTELYIDKYGRGMGKSIIIDTPAGNNLHAFLSAGSDLRISSRASGDYKTDEFYQENIPVMDEYSYTLDTFDVVTYPGFIETNPKLTKDYYHKESKLRNESKVDSTKERRRQSMETTKKTASSTKLKEARQRNAKIMARYEMLKKENTQLKAKLAKKEALIDAYSKFGDVKNVSNNIKELKEFKRIVKTPSLLKESNSKLYKTLIQAKIYKQEAAKLKKYHESLVKLNNVTKQYVKIGSIAEVKAIAKENRRLKDEQINKQISVDVRNYSKKTGLKLETVRSIFENAKNYSSAISTLESMKPVVDSSLYNKNETSNVPHLKSRTEKMSRSNKTKTLQGDVARRIVESRMAQLKRQEAFAKQANQDPELQ